MSHAVPATPLTGQSDTDARRNKWSAVRKKSPVGENNFPITQLVPSVPKRINYGKNEMISIHLLVR